MGILEDLAVHYAAVRGHSTIPREPELALAVFAADHGVAVEGVSAYPAEVTGKMVAAIATGQAAVSVLAKSHGIALSVTDVGVASALPAFDPSPTIRFAERRVANGTKNFVYEPAMSGDELDRALSVGWEEARRLAREGATVVGVGEVGIGNTTSAAALVCAFTGASPDAVVGRGTGIDDTTLARKRSKVTEALALHSRTNSDPRALLAALGGLELAAMTGFLLGAAEAKLLVVLDGFLASAAALGARALSDHAIGYCVASHESAEAGARIALEALGLEPLLRLRMRLGEGTGAALAMSLVRDSIRLEREMGTFASAGLA